MKSRIGHKGTPHGRSPGFEYLLAGEWKRYARYLLDLQWHYPQRYEHHTPDGRRAPWEGLGADGGDARSKHSHDHSAMNTDSLDRTYHLGQCLGQPCEIWRYCDAQLHMNQNAHRSGSDDSVKSRDRHMIGALMAGIQDPFRL